MALHSPAIPRRAWLLGGAAILSVSCALLVYSWLYFFTHGRYHAERPIPDLVVLLVLGHAVYFLVALLALREPPPLRTVLAFALLFRAALLPSRPLQEDDAYRYLWDGKVVAAGIDPYLFSPTEVLLELDAFRAADATVPPAVADPTRRGAMRTLIELAGRTPENGTILSRVNNPTYSSVYPPLSQYLFSIHGRMVPHEWAVAWQVAAMKCLLAVFDLGVVLLLPLLLRLAALPPGLSLLYSWCPLVLKEFANSGHCDSVAAFFVLLGLLFAVLAVRSAAARARTASVIFCAGALALAFLAKFYAAVLVPLVWRQLGWRRAAPAAAVGVALIAPSFMLFPGGASERTEVLAVFALHWENHAALFLLLRELMAATVSAGTFELELGDSVYTFSVASCLARALAAAGIAGVALWAAARARPPAPPREFLELAFLVLAALFLLGPLGFPWYFTWSVPLLPFARHRTWWLLPGFLMMYYLGFWYEYQSDDSSDWWSVVDASTLVEFGIFYLVLGVEVMRGERCRSRSTRTS